MNPGVQQEEAAAMGSATGTAMGPGVTRRRFCGLAAAMSPIAAWPQGRAAAADEVPLQIPLALSEALDPQFVTPLLRLIEQPARVRWTLLPVPFSRLLMMVEQGEAMGFGASPTDARAARWRFSTQVFRGAVWAVSRRGHAIDARRLEDLRGLSVCTSRQASYGAELDDAAGRPFRTEYVAGGLAQRLRTFQAGRCDVLLVTGRNASAAAMRDRLRAAGADAQALVIGERPLVEEGVHFAVAKDSRFAGVMPRLDAAIEARRVRIGQMARE
jgi:ABC-type amino acid transport substrate-binding protein